MISFTHQGLQFCGYDLGEGVPVVFQHGLGGDHRQIDESFPQAAPVRRLTLECRGHGGSDLGASEQLSIAQFADDVLAFTDSRGVSRFIAGGISTGAAIALRLAVLHPERVKALALVRPAWVTEAAPPNMRVFQELVPYLRMTDSAQGWAAFLETPTAQRLQREGPDNLASINGFFGSPRQLDVAALDERISVDGPGVTREQLTTLSIPVLVVGNEVDDVHPLAYAEELTRLIPQARLIITPSKALDKAGYLKALHSALSEFFSQIGQE